MERLKPHWEPLPLRWERCLPAPHWEQPLRHTRWEHRPPACFVVSSSRAHQKNHECAGIASLTFSINHEFSLINTNCPPGGRVAWLGAAEAALGAAHAALGAVPIGTALGATADALALGAPAAGLPRRLKLTRASKEPRMCRNSQLDVFL